MSSEVEVLYLFGNKITCIENLENMPNLASLYLQRNYIEKITNLTNLKNLKNLYLSRNYINVLEGLDDLKKLEELHIEKQNLDPEDCFCFDPRTIYKISVRITYVYIQYFPYYVFLKYIFKIILQSSVKNLKITYNA